jgi:putative flippase GtrA
VGSEPGVTEGTKASLRGLAQSRPVRFVLVGGGSALLLMTLSFAFMRLGVPPFAAGLGAYAICFVVAYQLQRNWTFRGAGRHSRTLPRYFIVQVCCALISGLLSHLLARALAWPPALASAGMTVCVAAISYFATSLWVFADEE